MNIPVPAGDDWWKPALDTNGIIDTDTVRAMLNDRFRIKADQLESEQKRRLEENDIDLKFWDDEYKRLARLRETKGNSDALAEILGADIPKGETTKAYKAVENKSDKELMKMATDNVIARKGAIAGGFGSPPLPPPLLPPLPPPLPPACLPPCLPPVLHPPTWPQSSQATSPVEP